HEMPVHHIDVNPVSAGADDRPYLVSKAGEIGREDRRRDQNIFGHVIPVSGAYNGRVAAARSPDAREPAKECSMTLMLASVTGPAEAELVLETGADIVDMKDPSAGALG